MGTEGASVDYESRSFRGRLSPLSNLSIQHWHDITLFFHSKTQTRLDNTINHPLCMLLVSEQALAARLRVGWSDRSSLLDD